MRGQTCWERNIECNDGTINVHITKQDSRKLSGVETPVFFIIPNRIGLDFYSFRDNGSIDYIPNASVSDIVQIIDRLHVLSSQIVREAFLKGVFKHKFGIELDFRRRLDFNIAINSNREEIIEMYYEDPKRFGRFLIGTIEVSSLILLQRALKECIVEYTYLTSKLLIE